MIDIELRKSRFQVNDPFILSVGNYKGRANSIGPLDFGVKTEVEAL
jgi:hypothetical protein